MMDKTPTSFVSSLIAIFILFSTSWAQAESQSFSYTFPEHTLKIIENGQTLSLRLQDTQTATSPVGAPALPVKQLRIPIALDATDITLSTKTECRTLVITRPVASIVPMAPPGISPSSAAPCRISSTPWAKLSGDHIQKGQRFVTVLLYPVRYSQEQSTLTLATQLSLSLSWKRRPTTAFYLQSETLSPAAYLVITNTALAPAFQTLADHRATTLSTAILTIEEIEGRYTGRDLQEKIREAIKEFVHQRQTHYVVLGGDDTIIPDRDTTASYSIFTETQIPTDLYYAGLSGNWDRDGDSVFGEVGEGDFAYDVVVGRIPVRTFEQAQAYIAKVKRWESKASQSLKSKFLLGGKELWHSYHGADRPTDSLIDTFAPFTAPNHPVVSDSEMWGRRAWRDALSPWLTTPKLSLLFDTLTSWGSTETCGDFPANLSHTSKVLNQGWEHLFVITHGKSQHWQMGSAQRFGTEAASQLTAPVAFIYTTACLTNHFDGPSDPSLSEAFIRAPKGGALAYIGSSRYGWARQDIPPADPTSTGGASLAFAKKFYQLFLSSQKEAATIGEAFYQHKLAFIALANQNSAERWLMLSLNLMGDPALRLDPPGHNRDENGPTLPQPSNELKGNSDGGCFIQSLR
ncbi:MAG: C25 family cysteine peptidase [Desulfobacterales bacterium]|nr:C25 family cysteine peptidase [Desulfobacterales bacterium]